MKSSLAAGLLLALSSGSTPGLARQSFLLEVEPSSTVALTGVFGVELPGSLIGDYDPTDNPTGTRTLPGLFGGSGNQPIPAEVGIQGTTDHAGPPTGRLVAEVDSTQLSIQVRELELDLLGGGQASTPLTLSLLFSTFRTFAPDSLFFGGFPINLPLGSQVLSDLLLVQTSPSAPGLLVPEPQAGRYSFVVLVQAALSFNIDFNGQAFPIGPVPILLPLTGQLLITGDTASISADFDFNASQLINDPLPGFTIDDVPLPLPTILPPGQTANLLFSAVIGSIEIAAAAALDLTASGSAPCGFESYCTANPNSTSRTTELLVSGSPDATLQQLEFSVTGGPPGQLGFLVVSPGETYASIYRGHQGGLCLTTPFTRLGQNTVTFGPVGTATTALDFSTLPSHVALVPGSTWRFQLWYRDQNPHPTWNSSNALRTRFCTAP
jgi:hypothetical protein